jgi:hypothetical protein
VLLGAYTIYLVYSFGLPVAEIGSVLKHIAIWRFSQERKLRDRPA